MERRVALLRGINVGTAKRIAMADLRTLFSDLGYTDVRTLLNSGNVVFSGAKSDANAEALRLEQAIATRLRVTTRITVLSAREIAAAVDDNPLRQIASNPSRLLLWVLDDNKAVAPLKPLAAERWEPDALALGKRVAYFWCADGLSKSQLLVAATRVLRDAGTARNLATMTKLRVLVEQK